MATVKKTTSTVQLYQRLKLRINSVEARKIVDYVHSSDNLDLLIAQNQNIKNQIFEMLENNKRFGK